MPFAHVNGQKLYYEDTGGEGPVIVFSHGLLMDGSMFAPQVEALRSTWRCITWDERGHGQTADLARCDPFTYYDSANDLAALLGHLGVETGGCPHTAIREDCSINLEAIDRMLGEFPNADIVFVESGGARSASLCVACSMVAGVKPSRRATARGPRCTRRCPPTRQRNGRCGSGSRPDPGAA